MKLSRKLITGGGALVLSLGLFTVLGAGAAAAKGKPVPSPASGTVTCSNVNAVVSFNPPLQAAVTTNSSVTLKAQMTKCGGSGQVKGTKPVKTTGHIMSVSLGTVPSNSCASLPAAAPAITAAAVKWTPPSKVAGSTVSMPAGTISTVGTQLQFAYTGGTVTGSFATTSASATLTSKQDVSTLSAECSGTGVASITLKGTATL